MVDLEQPDYHAKCSLAFFGSNTPPFLKYSLSEMNELAKEVVAYRIAVPGVQPKLSLSMGGNYIFKPPSVTYPEMPENEHLTMKIAEIFGIQTVPSSLIRLHSGELAYITKRIDRTLDAQKIHMLDMFQITEAVDKYKSTMERVGKALRQYSTDTLMDQLKYFELTIFCFLTGNNDMHLKNFSMITTISGWILSPAYDLLNVTIINPNDKEELALTLESKKRNLKLEDFVKFGHRLGLNDKQINGVFKRFIKNKPKALAWINKSFLSQTMKTNYIELLEIRYKIIC